MTKEIRWRIISLQAALIIVLAFGTYIAFWANGFSTGMVHDQLVAQQIFFPGKDQVKTGGALDPALFSQEIRDQAGNQVVTGDQARIYGEDFIGVHMMSIAGGKTYSQIDTHTGDAPAIAKATAQKDTLFKGGMLRASLLNAYAWWTMGVYAGYAAVALLIVTVGVLGALVFELLIAVRIEKPVVRSIKDAQLA